MSTSFLRWITRFLLEHLWRSEIYLGKLYFKMYFYMGIHISKTCSLLSLSLSMWHILTRIIYQPFHLNLKIWFSRSWFQTPYLVSPWNLSPPVHPSNFTKGSRVFKWWLANNKEKHQTINHNLTRCVCFVVVVNNQHGTPFIQSDTPDPPGGLVAMCNLL